MVWEAGRQSGGGEKVDDVEGREMEWEWEVTRIWK